MLYSTSRFHLYSARLPAPWGTVMKPTCHMFLIHLVEHFCTLGLTTWGIGPRWDPPIGGPRWVSGYKPATWGTVIKPTCHMFLIQPVEHFYAFGLTTWGLGPRWHPPRGLPRWVSGYRPAPWGTVMKPTCHMFLINLVKHFCALGLTNWGLGPRWNPPRDVPRWVSGYRPAPWGTVMKPTCHMFLIHLVEHFWALGLTTRGLGPRWHPPRGVTRWVSGYMPSPWWTVMKQTCHMFLIHLVEHFCALGLTTWGLGPRWHPPRGVPRWVSGYRPAPWGTVMKPTCHMFLINIVEHFCALGLTTWGLGPRWHPLEMQYFMLATSLYTAWNLCLWSINTMRSFFSILSEFD